MKLSLNTLCISVYLLCTTHRAGLGVDSLGLVEGGPSSPFLALWRNGFRVGCGSVAEFLLSVCGALGSIPNNKKAWVHLVLFFLPWGWEVRASSSSAQSQGSLGTPSLSPSQGEGDACANFSGKPCLLMLCWEQHLGSLLEFFSGDYRIHLLPPPGVQSFKGGHRPEN